MLKTDSVIFYGNIKYLTAQQIFCRSLKKIWLVENQRLSAQ